MFFLWLPFSLSIVTVFNQKVHNSIHIKFWEVVFKNAVIQYIH